MRAFPSLSRACRAWPGIVLAAISGAPVALAQEPVPTEGSVPETPLPPVQAIDRQGITLEFSVEGLGPDGEPCVPREGGPARVGFRIRDTTSGRPQVGLDPGGWIHGHEPDQDCADKVAGFLAGGLTGRARIDLNTFFVLALNENGTISVVDPLFGYGGSQLLTLIDLGAPGDDWIQAGRRVFVSVPDAHAIAVIDTREWKRVAMLPAPGRVTRLVLQPDGRRLWGSVERAPGAGPDDPGFTGVVVVDTGTLEIVDEVALDPGPHELAFDGPGRHAFVTNAAAGTVAVLDTWSRGLVRTWEVGGRPVSVAHSTLGDAVFVVEAERGRVLVFDEARLEPVARIDLGPGLGALRFTPDGRHGFLCHPERRAVHVLDAAGRRLLQTAEVTGQPDSIAFTESLAFVRALDSEIVEMIPLAALGEEGAPVAVVDFPGGQSDLGAGAGPTRAPGIVPAPEGTAVLVANPGDGAIYYYKEGMAAPMGHFGNFGHQPRAVLVVDRSLRELEPGFYASDIVLPRAGRYDALFFLDSPRLIECFAFDVAIDPEVETLRAYRRSVVLEPVAGASHASVGQPYTAAVRLRDVATQEALVDVQDLRAVVFNPRGWTWRQTLEVGDDGLYRVTFVPPDRGAYYVSFELPSRGLRFEHLRSLTLRADPPETPPTEKEAGRR